jgi:hypothetical protein
MGGPPAALAGGPPAMYICVCGWCSGAVVHDMEGAVLIFLRLPGRRAVRYYIYYMYGLIVRQRGLRRAQC